jgi:hypothetical protein
MQLESKDHLHDILALTLKSRIEGSSRDWMANIADVRRRDSHPFAARPCLARALLEE